MPKIEFTGLNEYMNALEKLSERSNGITKKALYEGVAVTADEVRASIAALPTDENWGTQKNPSKGIKKAQKQALLDGLGVSGFRQTGDRIDALVGFSGYSDYKTAKYPNGQPLPLIARVAESGTSFSKKTPFMAKAVRKAKGPAEARMKEVFESEIEKIMKE